MSSDYILEMSGISKKFPGVKALSKVNFNLKKGEVHALVGENGAGKSTLIKVLAGVHRADEGSICLRGQKIEARSTKEMIDYGISVIYQELNLIPYLSVAENIFLGREPLNKYTKFIDWKEMYKKVNEIMQIFKYGYRSKNKNPYPGYRLSASRRDSKSSIASIRHYCYGRAYIDTYRS